MVQSTKVLLAQTDDVVPHECSERLMAAWPGPVAVQTIAGTDHYTIVERPETWLALCDFARQVPHHPPQAARETPPADLTETGAPLPLSAAR